MAASVWVDFRPGYSGAPELADALEPLRSAGAGVLLGDHVDDVTPRSPAEVAEAIAPHSIPFVSTLTCRDRSAAELTDQVRRLRHAGVAAVHCVTGDHPAARLGLDRPSRFELDGTRLTALAAATGPVSVAESPASPPRAWRATRLLSKQRAGATMAILNHGGEVARLTRFARQCRDEGVTLALVAPVPVITDHRSAEALARFPGLELPPGLTDAVLGSRSPRLTGIRVAADLAGELLASELFEGVNLSGSGADIGLTARSEMMAEIAGAVV